MDFKISESLCQEALGALVFNYVKTLRPDQVLPLAESEAVKLLCEIKAILDDDTADDPNCFQRIDAIVKAFGERGMDTLRHDW